MKFNRYVRGGSVRIESSGEFRMTSLFGAAVSDPMAADRFGPVGVPSEMVIYIGGFVEYPTSAGHIRLEAKP